MSEEHPYRWGNSAAKEPQPAKPRPKPPTVESILSEARQLYLDRMPAYGDVYKRFPHAFLALFPGHKIPAITTIDDANRLQLMMQLLNKMTRYAQNFERGGHKDSARDMIVYAAMLEEQTDQANPTEMD